MKISLITISNNELVAINKNDTIPLITSYLHKNGFEVMNNFVSNSVYENIVNNLKNTIDDADFTLCIVENELDVAFLTKKAICSLMETELTVNNFAKTNILSEILMRLGVDEKTATDDACKMEHILSDESFDAMKKHLNGNS